jgi:hypothetical protein
MSNNILDSRDLEQELTELLEQFNDWRSNLTDEEIYDLAEKCECEVSDLTELDFLLEWDSSDSERIAAIQDLKNEVNSREWDYGIQFVKDSYFEEFALDEAENIGAFNARENSWPYNCIDWKKAAEELQYDYSSVEFDGLTYWYRDC